MILPNIFLANHVMKISNEEYIFCQIEKPILQVIRKYISFNSLGT
jgi:hypothetical protein